jgi:hypothetical protein
MGCGRPLVGGGCVFKGGNELRHAWSIRLSDPVGNESPAAAAPRPSRSTSSAGVSSAPLAPGVIQSRRTLAEFVRGDWWPRHVVATLKPSTQRRYLEVWGTHVLPHLGDYELRAITPLLVEDLRARLTKRTSGCLARGRR